jgi:hypothetical protein
LRLAVLVGLLFKLVPRRVGLPQPLVALLLGLELAGADGGLRLVDRLERRAHLVRRREVRHTRALDAHAETQFRQSLAETVHHPCRQRRVAGE